VSRVRNSTTAENRTKIKQKNPRWFENKACPRVTIPC
jgi:hypothetical protein